MHYCNCCSACKCNLLRTDVQSNVSSVLNAKKVVLAQETTDQSRATIQKVAEEGMVLLKNDGILPLSSDTKKLNVFGWDSTNPLFGGTGSGSSDSSTAIGILQSLKDAFHMRQSSCKHGKAMGHDDLIA